MKVPDFYIVGAPKSGTTALSEYLRQHPNVCFSHVKEPHFFADDLPSYKMDRTIGDYLRRNFSHFDGRRHRAVGEGSVYYYISDVAIAKVLEAQPSAKFVYAIRNPADMVYSLYWQYRLSNMETLDEFEAAWEQQDAREAGRNIPRHCYEPRFLQYRAMGRLGQRLQVLKAAIPATQLMVVVFDDFVRDTRRVYEDVLRFLDLPSDDRRTFPVINESKVQRSELIAGLLASIPTRLHNVVRDLKHGLGLSHIPLNLLAMLNVKPAQRPPLSESFRSRLIAEFEPDVRLLETQLGRSLETWRS